MKLSVIVPVHNGGDDLHLCLEALAESQRLPDQVVVVDDVSTDGSPAVASQSGVELVRLYGKPHGPAFARNRGAEIARGDVLIFVDADVVVHGDTLKRIERCLVDHPAVSAVFGSYDDDPPGRRVVSRFKNLLHHYVHQQGKREAATFWAGCGAIRSRVFDELGGFDERYDRPSIEDIELGTRLRGSGHSIWLRPEIQVTHLKTWTLGSLLKADICNRAIPWTRLVMRESHVPADLNLDLVSRLSAVLVWMALVLAVAGVWNYGFWAGTLITLLCVGMLNRGLYRFFAQKGGGFFAAGAAGLHLLYLLYSSATFGITAILTRLKAHFVD